MAERQHPGVAQQYVVGQREEAEDEHLGEETEVERRVVGVERRRGEHQRGHQQALHSSAIPSWPKSPRGRTSSTIAIIR